MMTSKHSRQTFWQRLTRLPNKISILVIQLYRALFSPSEGILRFLPFYPRPSCIFYPTCSAYGMACFKKYPFPKAFYKTLDRIGRCHPKNEPRVDNP